MQRQLRVAHVVALVVIGVCVLAVPVLAQDRPALVGSQGASGPATNVSGTNAEAHAADGEDPAGGSAPPAIAGKAFNPQIIIWTDPLTNSLGATAYDAQHDEFMVGWTTWQDQWSRDIWARRLTPDGTLLEHFNVANAAGEQMQGPAIEYCPLHEQYLFAFENFYDGNPDRADVQARRVAWDGGWMSDVFMISPGVALHASPSIAYSTPDDEYLVTYANYWPGGEHDLYAQRIRASDGAFMSLSGVPSGDGWGRTDSQVAFHPDAYDGDGGYLIAYYALSPTGDHMVRYKMTRTDLSDLWGNPEVDASSTTLAMPNLQLDVGDAGFLITWWEANVSGVQVKARRISFEGVALGPPEGIPVSGSYVYSPPNYGLAVTYAHPHLYLVLWQHETPTYSFEIHGIFVSEDADTTLGDEFVLSGTGTNLSSPEAVCSPLSDCLFAYEWSNPPSSDIAGEIVRLVVMFSDGFESGDTSAWSVTVP